MTRPCSLLIVAILTGGGAARGQLVQYSPPGNLGAESGSNQELIDGAIQSARWRLGRVYVHPSLSFRNVTYAKPFRNPNLLADSGASGEADLTATAGAGLRAYLPVGSKISLAVHALPEYVWWRDQKERRRLNGRYGGGLFGDLGRISLEATVTRNDRVQFFSREFEERVNQRTDSAIASAEMGVVGGLSVYGVASVTRHEVLEDEEAGLSQLATLDRDEERFSIGSRYRFVRGLRVGIGFEDFQIDFDEVDSRRATSGQAVIVDFRLGTAIWSVSADLAFQSVEIGIGPDPLEDDDLRGRLRGSWQAASRLWVDLYADRNLVYSFQEDAAFFNDNRVGVGIRTSLRSFASFRVFAELGRLNFTSFESQGPERVDDFRVYGGDLRIGYRGLTLFLGVTHTDYESNFPEFDRDVTVTSAGLQFGLTFTRRGLTIGTGGISFGTGELSPWA